MPFTRSLLRAAKIKWQYRLSARKGASVAGYRKVTAIEADILAAERQIHRIKDELAALSDMSANLSNAAAMERARNAQSGRGIGGALFGAKYRAAARRAAASSNAAISREVATKRSDILQAKQNLKAHERELREVVRELKADLKIARTFEQEEARETARAQAREQVRQREAKRGQPPPRQPERNPAPQSIDIKAELQRLKALHQRGELDAAGYELARIALLQPHVR